MRDYPTLQEAAKQQAYAQACIANGSEYAGASLNANSTALGAVQDRLAMLDKMAAEAERSLGNFAERLNGPRPEATCGENAPCPNGALGALHTRIDSIERGLNAILLLSAELQNVA